MTRRKAAANGTADGNEPATAAAPKAVAADSEPRDVIKANNANLTELKHTLDDTLKRVRAYSPLQRDLF
jgi:signal peptidase complex subunit 2